MTRNLTQLSGDDGNNHRTFEQSTETDVSRREVLRTTILGTLGIPFGTVALSECAALAQSPSMAGSLTTPPSAPVCVLSIAELRALTPWETGEECVIVLGYWSPGDGGGGLFYWDSNSTEPDNGGTVIISDDYQEPGRWKRVYDGTLSVKMFGAKGDGSADDTTAIQAALDASLNVFIPEGTYLTRSILRVRSGQVVKGASSLRTIIKNTTTNGLAKRAEDASVRDVHLEGFRIQSANDGTNTLTAFDLQAFSYSRFEDLAAQFTRNGFRLARGPAAEAAFFNHFRDIYCLNNFRGLWLDDSSGFSPNAHTFLNVFVEDVGVWSGGIGLDISGWGHVFEGIYVGLPGGSAAVRLQPVTGNNLFIRLYGESSITYLIDVGGGTSGRKNYFFGTHMDSLTMVLTNAPNDRDLKIYNADGFNELAITRPEAIVRLNSTRPEGRIWQLVSGGGAEIGAGEWALRDETNNRILIRVKRAADGESLQIDAAGDGETALLLRRNVGGRLTLQRVSMGPADSAGTGFRVLRVPN